ncbi:hypothetical protein [Subsaximicrobium wynnwilliamsii]|nr:hypothetical protein [Subsaximicrobium wynnwilliamsii]
MMTKSNKPQYTNFKQVDHDLKRLNLERKIAVEELKIVKSDYIEALSPYNWLQTGLKFAGKYGVFVLLKKLFR